MTQVVFTVGNEMMGDDGAGILLARRLQEMPLAGWEILHGGAAPENYLHQVRLLAPQRVVIVDVAEMDLEPGVFRRISPEEIADPFLLTTHTLPLTFLIEALQEFVPQVELIGIQPELIAFGLPVSPAVRAAVEAIYQQLACGSI